MTETAENTTKAKPRAGKKKVMRKAAKERGTPWHKVFEEEILQKVLVEKIMHVAPGASSITGLTEDFNKAYGTSISATTMSEWLSALGIRIEVQTRLVRDGQMEFPFMQERHPQTAEEEEEEPDPQLDVATAALMAPPDRKAILEAELRKAPRPGPPGPGQVAQHVLGVEL